MANRNSSSDTMPDKKLLDTCVSAFEIAIREIRKIENCDSEENLNEPIVLDKSALAAMSAELAKYGWELYSTGFKNGRDDFSRAEDTVADEIDRSISDIIRKTVFSNSRKQRGSTDG